MTDAQLKLIYKYMGWTWHNVTSKTGEVSTCSCGQRGMMVYEVCHKENQQKLDSNLAWECVQEMERKERGAYHDFLVFSREIWDREIPENDGFYFWIADPTNFFNCFAAWLEGREK